MPEPETADRLTLADLCKVLECTVEELLQEHVDDNAVPALCSELCEVEPDGECVHGHPSFLKEVGF